MRKLIAIIIGISILLIAVGIGVYVYFKSDVSVTSPNSSASSGRDVFKNGSTDSTTTQSAMNSYWCQSKEDIARNFLKQKGTYPSSVIEQAVKDSASCPLRPAANCATNSVWPFACVQKNADARLSSAGTDSPKNGSVIVSGRVYDTDTGEGFSGATIDFCDGVPGTTGVDGKFSREIAYGKGFCVRITPWTRTGYSGPSLNYNPGAPQSGAYEWQKAGIYCQNSTLCNEFEKQMDRSQDSGYDFRYGKNSTPTSAGGNKKQAAAIGLLSVASTPPPVSVDIKADGSDVPLEVSTGDTVSLTWTSTNATSCQALNGWSGTKSISGNEQSPIITQNIWFTISCTGSGGTAEDTAIIRVDSTSTPTPSQTPVPGVSFNISKSGLNITAGETEFIGVVDAHPGDRLRFNIRITSTAAVTMSNILVSDLLPTLFVYQTGSTKIDGVAAPDGIADAGLSLSPLTAGGVTNISFEVALQGAEAFDPGETSVTNRSTAEVVGTLYQDASMDIIVSRECPLGGCVPTGTDTLPWAFIVSALVTTAYYLFYFALFEEKYVDKVAILRKELANSRRRAIMHKEQKYVGSRR